MSPTSIAESRVSEVWESLPVSESTADFFALECRLVVVTVVVVIVVVVIVVDDVTQFSRRIALAKYRNRCLSPSQPRIFSPSDVVLLLLLSLLLLS